MSDPRTQDHTATGAALFDMAGLHGVGRYEVWAQGVDLLGQRESVAGGPDAVIIADDAPALFLNIVVRKVTAKSAEIMWRTSERTTGVLSYGLDATYGTNLPQTRKKFAAHHTLSMRARGSVR